MANFFVVIATAFLGYWIFRTDIPVNFLSGFSFLGFFTGKEFLVPFLSTIMASLTIIILQFFHSYITDKKKKIYVLNYMSDVCHRILFSNLVIKKHTIIPHIVAVKKILKGDVKLLEKMFLSDEFDILTADPFNFGHLAEEYKVLVGYDDIGLVQLFETINYLNLNENRRRALNEFVKNNLKSQHLFSLKEAEEQTDILSQYWDHLDGVKHDVDRLISFVSELAVKEIEKYSSEKQFVFFSKKIIMANLKKINGVLSDFSGVLPDKDFIPKSRFGGIQNEI